jgi:flagellar basal body-associated protein FliL
MQPNQPNNYDFILNANHNPKRSFFNGKSKLQRTIIIALGVIVLIILMLVISSYLGKAGRVKSERLLELAQTQAEIIRTTSIATSKASDANTRALAATARLSVETDQRVILDSLAKRYKPKVLDAKLPLGRNDQTDALLAEATNNNRFDETYRSLLAQQLSDYQKLINQIMSTTNPTERETLQGALDSNAVIAASYKSK